MPQIIRDNDGKKLGSIHEGFNDSYVVRDNDGKKVATISEGIDGNGLLGILAIVAAIFLGLSALLTWLGNHPVVVAILVIIVVAIGSLIVYALVSGSKKNPAIEHHNKGAALQKLGKYEEAIAAYDQAIRLNPDAAKAFYNKGGALRKLGKYEEAIAAYDQAIRLNPDDVIAYCYKSISLICGGKNEAARAVHDQAIRLNPDAANAFYNKQDFLLRRMLGHVKKNS